MKRISGTFEISWINPKMRVFILKGTYVAGTDDNGQDLTGQQVRGSALLSIENAEECLTECKSDAGPMLAMNGQRVSIEAAFSQVEAGLLQKYKLDTRMNSAEQRQAGSLWIEHCLEGFKNQHLEDTLQKEWTETGDGLILWLTYQGRRQMLTFEQSTLEDIPGPNSGELRKRTSSEIERGVLQTKGVPESILSDWSR